MFFDQIHLLVQAGNGGDGCDSFQSRTDRKIVPNGGDGAKGGSVIFRADTNAPSLGHFRFKQHLIAQSGGAGKSVKKRGRMGEDLIVLVPCGTKIFDRERNLLIRELVHSGDQVVVVEGGAGGSGSFGGKKATPGEKGKAIDIELRLSVQADIFLVGLPNSGKSTFLNSFTGTKIPEEAYPFSTKYPYIGVWMYDDYERLTLCELPSIYEGSQDGKGLGRDFLKHLEKARLILYFINPLSEFAPSLQDGWNILREQIKGYDEKFLSVPAAVVVNKIDLPEAKSAFKREAFDPGVPVYAISTVTGENVEELKKHMVRQVVTGF